MHNTESLSIVAKRKTELDETIFKWLKEFEKNKGRPLRVLHIGNVANNAYLNAKLLREFGVEADVLCRDYYHVMSCPEWEELDINRNYGDDFYPRLHPNDLQKYKRPEWFIQGALPLCRAYIKAKFNKNNWKATKVILRFLLRTSSLTAKHHYAFSVLAYACQDRKMLVRGIDIYRKQLKDKIKNYDFFKKTTAEFFCLCLLGLNKIFHIGLKNNIDNDGYYGSLISEFNDFFKNRTYKLTIDNLNQFRSMEALWKDIASYYDIVQCYGTEPMMALVANIKPFVAYEHGTLRDFTMGDFPLHCINALAYRHASHVFITNGDCLEYAKKLGIQHYSPMVHPIFFKPEVYDENELQDIKKLRERYDADVLLFCPIRHDWDIKGTDLHIRALPNICQKLMPKKVILLLIHWGLETSKSCDLIEKLGCGSQIIWLRPLSRLKLVKHMLASDVVLDQMALPHFGATAPQALALGVPVIMSYQPHSTAWMFSEPAPILAAFTEQEIVKMVLLALEPNWRIAYKKRAQNWMRTFHHTDKIVKEHLKIYKKIIEEETAV